MKKEPILQYVRRKLDDHKGLHREIADTTGVPYTTLRNIAQGVTQNPGVQAVQSIADYFGSKRN